MKNLLIISISLFLLTASLVVADNTRRVLPRTQNPQAYIQVSPAATTTEQIAARYTYYFESTHSKQGTCIIIKDKDGKGYTSLTTLNGTATFSATPCN